MQNQHPSDSPRDRIGHIDRWRDLGVESFRQDLTLARSIFEDIQSSDFASRMF